MPPISRCLISLSPQNHPTWSPSRAAPRANPASNLPPPCLFPHLSAAAAPLLAVHPSFQGWWAGLRGERL